MIYLPLNPFCYILIFIHADFLVSLTVTCIDAHWAHALNQHLLIHSCFPCLLACEHSLSFKNLKHIFYLPSPNRAAGSQGG